MKIIIETKRFYLREITRADVPNFYALDSDPEVHLYLGNNPVTKTEESEKMVNGVLNQYENNGFGRLAIIDKQTHAFIGWSGLKYETTVRKEPYNDLGYRLIKQYWGKGIATETSIASLKYGFEELGLTEIFGGAHVENIGSNKVLKKVGMKFLEVFEFEGEDHNWYGLTKSDWLIHNNK